MTQNQPISAERAVDLLVPLLPELARVEVYPQWSDGTGVPVRRQRVTLYDAGGDILGATREEHRQVLRVLLRVEDADWDRPQTFTLADAVLHLALPVVPLWESPVAEPVPSAGALAEQRHQVEDPAVPPLAVADDAADFARSVADGFVTLPDWGVCDPQPAPAREVQDVPVAGEAL